MSNQYQIGEKVTFKTKVFGAETIKTNFIYDVKIEDNKVLYLIHGVGQMLFGKDLNGSEDCFIVNEDKII